MKPSAMTRFVNCVGPKEGSACFAIPNVSSEGLSMRKNLPNNTAIVVTVLAILIAMARKAVHIQQTMDHYGSIPV